MIVHDIFRCYNTVTYSAERAYIYQPYVILETLVLSSGHISRSNAFRVLISF